MVSKPKRRHYCPVHRVKLVKTSTTYGPRFDCPEKGCTVQCWNGPTSRPADLETRRARKRAHSAFDPLWRGGLIKRSYAYQLLQEHLGTLPGKCHIGMFDVEQCERTVVFSRELAKRLCGQNGN